MRKGFVHKTLLLVSRQVYEEMIVVMWRFLSSEARMGKMRYKLDIILEWEDRLHASWTRFPFFRDSRILSITDAESESRDKQGHGQGPVHVDTVDVNIRIVGNNGPKRGRLIRAGSGGPGIIVWPLLELLDGFIRYGPSFRPKQSTSFIPHRVPANDQLEVIAAGRIATKANLLRLTITPCYALDPGHGKPGYQAGPHHSTARWISYGMGHLACRGGRESRKYGNYLRAGIGRVELYDVDEREKISREWNVGEATGTAASTEKAAEERIDSAE
jgi:hypothetical protein